MLKFYIALFALLGSLEVQAQVIPEKTQDLSDARLQLMRDRAMRIEFLGRDIPKNVETTPLFRYDDLARGYQDGTVWRLGKSGRPLAIVTTELHPRYGLQGTNQSNPRVVYDLLSLASTTFRAKSPDFAWSPAKAAVVMKPLMNVPEPSAISGRRLLQLKEIARRFEAIQHVNETGTEDQQLVLRLLPQNIDRFQASDVPNSDGAIFLFVAGRMPGVLLVVETDGKTWQFGVGRLSGPSKLTLSFDDDQVWAVDPSVGNSAAGYYATNGPAKLPGE